MKYLMRMENSRKHYNNLLSKLNQGWNKRQDQMLITRSLARIWVPQFRSNCIHPLRLKVEPTSRLLVVRLNLHLRTSHRKQVQLKEILYRLSSNSSRIPSRSVNCSVVLLVAHQAQQRLQWTRTTSRNLWFRALISLQLENQGMPRSKENPDDSTHWPTSTLTDFGPHVTLSISLFILYVNF